MKKAQLLNGQAVIASDSAPTSAVCPICGGEVKLRQRQLMNKEKSVYFWRHRSNQNLNCQRRRRGVSWRL